MSGQAVETPATTPEDDERVEPSSQARSTAFGLLVISLLVAVAFDLGGSFAPRVPTVDALAALTIGAFFVDRLLTFFPPTPLRKLPAERSADINMLRWGYGAALGAVFVICTDLRAVDALTGDAHDISAPVDRALAVLAIAGGTVGLARVLEGLKPTAGTNATDEAAAKQAVNEAAGVTKKDDEPLPPPSSGARQIGYAGLLAAAGIAAIWVLTDNEKGVELLGKITDADGSVAVAVRFSLVILAAAIVEQAVERTLGWWKPPQDKKLVTGAAALVLGVLIARVMDLYLLHNLGFFTEPGTRDPINDRLAASSPGERWFDAFVTGVVIAAGTRPLHDLSSRLRKTPEKKQKEATAAVAAATASVPSKPDPPPPADPGAAPA